MLLEELRNERRVERIEVSLLVQVPYNNNNNNGSSLNSAALPACLPGCRLYVPENFVDSFAR